MPPPPPNVLAAAKAAEAKAAEVEAAPRLRIKPKLSPEPAPASAQEPAPEPPVVQNFVPPPAPPVIEAPVALPVSAPPPPAEAPAPGVAPESAVDSPRFKLKGKLAPPGTTPPMAPLVIEPKGAADSKAAVDAPKPVGLKVPDVKRLTAPPFPVIAPPAGPGSTPPIPVPAPKPLSRAAKTRQILVKAGIGFGIIALFGVALMVRQLYFSPPPPKPIIHPLAKAPTPKPVQAAPATASSATPPPAAVAASEPAATPREAAPAAPTPPPAPPRQEVAIASSTSIAPDVTATTTEVEAGTPASAPFLKFIDEARIGGVFQGSPARALINGKVTRAGQTVDDSLGITFTGLDVEHKLLLFSDRSGATTSKHY